MCLGLKCHAACGGNYLRNTGGTSLLEVTTQPKGFVFRTGTNSDHEVCTVALWASAHKIPWRFQGLSDPLPDPNWVPVGTVDFVERHLGRGVPPDYFPSFLSSWVKRRVWTTDKWPYGERVFIKPADRHKRFTGFITKGGWKGKKRGSYVCSEIVRFTNEWRYYVANGKLVTARWYWGDDVNTPPAPSIDVEWPADWCGTADFGTYEDGTIALVEANSPFSTGWYGSQLEGEPYVGWLLSGWDWLRNKSYHT